MEFQPKRSERNLKREVEAVIPVDERTVTASINKGIPLIVSDRSSPQSRALMQLMGTIKQRLADAENQKEEGRSEGAAASVGSLIPGEPGGLGSVAT